MTVVGLHPEELFDKLLGGELSVPERDRLRAHLEGCDVCRFEYEARLDFQVEALELAVTSAPPDLPLRPLQIAGASRSAGRRPRSRRLIWGLAAAALISASGAVASGVVGRASWHAVRSMSSWQASPPAQLAPAVGKRARVLVAKAAASAEAAAPRPNSQPAAPRARAIARPPAPSARVASEVAAAADLPSATDAPAKEPASAAKLFGEANQARRSGDIGRASGLYHLLQDQYPGSPEAELSRVTLALLLLDSGDARGALSGFERYLAGASRGLEAEALVGRARALGRLGRSDLEAAAWREVQRKYPRSIYGRQAGERLSALGQP